VWEGADSSSWSVLLSLFLFVCRGDCAGSCLIYMKVTINASPAKSFYPHSQDDVTVPKKVPHAEHSSHGYGIPTSQSSEISSIVFELIYSTHERLAVVEWLSTAEGFRVCTLHRNVLSTRLDLYTNTTMQLQAACSYCCCGSRGSRSFKATALMFHLSMAFTNGIANGSLL
jgi:hypothetical protein